MKAWEVIAYVHICSVICPGCRKDQRIPEQECYPIFASDEHNDGLFCDSCFDRIVEPFNPEEDIYYDE